MKAGNDISPIAGMIFYLLGGPLIWAGHLFLIYGPQSALCAFRITGVAEVDVWLVWAVTGGVTLLAVLALIYLLWQPRQVARVFRATPYLDDEGSFHSTVMRLLTMLSLAGVLWAGMATLMLDPCGALR